MELQFEKKSCNCLRRNVWEVQNMEQTQEVRLPEGMPDIGTILASWGQCVMRGKEWRNDGMSVSGGVMAWVLYAPADGTVPQCMEVWLPVQGKWSFPDSRREGTIRASWLLRGVDARTISARKMMVRANVGILGEALEPWEAEISVPGELPQDVQLLRRTYPMQLPKEAGEKTFLMDEGLTMSHNAVAPEKIISCHIQPRLTERKVLGGKVVFRGNGNFHMLYRGVDGQLYGADFEVPFSQFSDLDRDYDKEATASVMMAVSSLEPELQEGAVHLKCGLVAQYLVYDQQMLELVEDAYSPNRDVRVETQELTLPAVLDICRETVRAETAMEAQASRMIEASICSEHPVLRRAGDLVELEFGGTTQMLYYDEEGALRGCTNRWSDTWEHPAGSDSVVMAQIVDIAPLEMASGGGQLRAAVEMQAESTSVAQQGISMVTALDLGEMARPDPGRPSLVLRRAGEESLWELAKNNGSTVDAIRKANGLMDEPLDDRLLLIPVS